MGTIRLYTAADHAALRACVKALQDYERRLSPDRVPGSRIVAGYVRRLVKENRARRGRIFVAVAGGKVAGYANVKTRSTIFSTPARYAYVTDLFVLPAARRRGLGSALLDAAAEWALKRRFRVLEIAVLHVNGVARATYEAVGFRDYEVTMRKKLVRPAKSQKG